MAASRPAGGTAFPDSRHDHGGCVASALAAAERLCAERGVRLTPLRRRVLELVWLGHRPVGAYAILERLAGERPVAPPTVYRALEFLAAQGLIHRIERLNAFIGCVDPVTPHAGQFLICGDCGTAAELADRRIDAAIAASAAELGFEVRARTVEVVGLCPDCGRERDDG